MKEKKEEEETKEKEGKEKEKEKEKEKMKEKKKKEKVRSDDIMRSDDERSDELDVLRCCSSRHLTHPSLQLALLDVGEEEGYSK